jgi:hypothetical protein
MALASFTQAGFEAYQNIFNVADLTIGNAFNISASKHLLPAATGTQDIGSSTLVFRKGYFGALSTTVNLGTTAITLDRASGAQSLTGISIDGLAGSSTKMVVSDTRAVVDTPETTASPGIWADFKSNTTNSLADGGSFNGVMSIRQYGSGTDWSGGKAHQLAFTDNDNIWHRSGSSTTWGTWYKLIHTNNLSSITSVGTLTGLTSSGAVSITNNTASSSTSTGALTITGGLGVGGAIYAGASSSISATTVGSTSLSITNPDTGTGSDARLILSNGTNTASILMRSTTNVAESNALVISSGASGNLILYAAGASRATISSTSVAISLATASTSTSTGALTIAGGLGVGGAVFASSFSGSGAALTSLTAGNLSGTIPAAVLGNSSVFIGTTSIALNRASGAIALTGITSIDGDAATVDGKSINAITQWGVAYADTATSLAGTAAGTAAQILQSNGAAAPTWSTFDMATHSPLFAHKLVKWATTVDIAPSTFSANVLTGYSNTNTTTVTTTLNSLSLTLASTVGVKVGAAVSVATTNIPANTLIPTISSATVAIAQNVPGWTLATTAITGAAGTATATFAAQAGAPYSVGSTIYVSGATPTTYNGTFTVTACTTTTVSWASAETVTATVQGSITNLITTAITGTGTTATATFAAKTYAPYAVGASITISGATPTTYNGTFTVTACTTSSVSWASTETVTATVQGYVNAGIAAGTTVSHTFAQTIAAFTPDGTAATVNDRVLVKDITTVAGLNAGAAYRGIYTVTTVGSTTVPWVLTRATDADTVAELAGALVTVSAGTANGGRTFTGYTKSTDTLNTTAVVFNKHLDQMASSATGSIPVTASGIDLSIETKSVQVNGGSIADLAASSIGRMTVAATSASTYTRASSLYIAGTPVASTNTTMTDVYSIYVAQGRNYFTSGTGGGALQAVGYSASYGALTTPNTFTGALNVIMGTASNATWLISGTSNATFRGGIQLLDAGGAMRLYSNTTTGLAVVASDLQPFTAGTGNIGTTALRFASVNANAADINGTIKSASNVIIQKTSGLGIQVDTTTPTFPFRDLIGQLVVRGSGVNNPTWAAIMTNIYAYQFTVNQEIWLTFHVDHDYVPGTVVYIHTHWTHNSTTVTTGGVTWTFDVTAAKGHQQAAFAAAKTTSVTQTATPTTQYEHFIAETALTVAGGSASLIDTALIEPDTLIMVRVSLTGNTLSAATNPFLLSCDLHYQSTGIGTKARAPNFYV